MYMSLVATIDQRIEMGLIWGSSVKFKRTYKYLTIKQTSLSNDFYEAVVLRFKRIRGTSLSEQKNQVNLLSGAFKWLGRASSHRRREVLYGLRPTCSTSLLHIQQGRCEEVVHGVFP